MNALLVLFAGNLSGEAVSPTAQPLINEKNSLILALQRAQSFPGVGLKVFPEWVKRYF